MIEPTWDDWFVREELEGVTPDGLSVWYLGCNGFVLRTAETTVYIDPYFGTGSHRPYAVRMLPVPMDPEIATLCDAVLVTHEHVDHMHPPSYGPLLETTGANIYAPETCFETPDYDGDLQVSEDRRVPVSPGETFTVGDFTMHVRGAHDPDAKEPLSYVIEAENGTFFHPGDSKPAPEFDEIGASFDIDVGALAFGTTGTFVDPETDTPRTVKWYMNGDQVIETCNALEMDRLLPTHHDMWKGFGASPSVLHDHAASSQHPKTIDVIEVGDRIELGQPGIVPPTYAR